MPNDPTLKLITDEELASTAILVLDRSDWEFEFGSDSDLGDLLEGFKDRCEAIGCLMPLVVLSANPTVDIATAVDSPDMAVAVVDHLTKRFEL